MKNGVSFFITGTLLGITSSECPNACSSHGKCGAFDVCTCYKNYFGNDCSLRLCQYGRAFADTPLGDLDSSNDISGPDDIVIPNSQIYPYGTTEQYPHMVDSKGRVLQNTAHDYSECSSKGKCNRDSGTCSCFTGYTGSACQRTRCPIYRNLNCYGRGTCMSAAEMAQYDHGNVYELWDRDKTYGCLCDPGSYNTACTELRCKYGYDPLYFDETEQQTSVTARRFANWSLVIFTRSSTATILGNFSLSFFDVYGKNWSTSSIPYGADCRTISDALESLPNRAIPYGSVRCVMWPDYNIISTEDEPVRMHPNPFHGVKYTIAFPKNPGILKQISANIYLDGNRPTLFSDEVKSTLGTFVYPNGYTGEFTDYFPKKCVGVDVTIAKNESYYYLSGLSSFEARLLQRCLGKADLTVNSYSATNKVEGQTYGWDYGSIYNPHLIRLVSNEYSQWTDLCPGRDFNSQRLYPTQIVTDAAFDAINSCNIVHPPGFFVPLYYDKNLDEFVILTRQGADYSPDTVFAVFTGNSTTQMVSEEVMIHTDPRNPYSTTVFATNSSVKYAAAKFDGNLDCATSFSNENGALTCINKGDFVFFLNPYDFDKNPKYVNIYEVKRLYQGVAIQGLSPYKYRVLLDMSINGAWNVLDAQSPTRIYKFYPSGGYTYVSECGNRGLCDTTVGICRCFSGFYMDDCSVQGAVTL